MNRTVSKEVLERAIILLDAATEVIDVYQMVHYDEADCDGYCLIDDIHNHVVELKEAMS